MPRIFYGVRQRPATLSYYVGCNRVKSEIIVVQIKFTIKRANAQIHTSPEKPNVDKKSSQRATKVMTCTYFNQNSCSFGKTHETKGVLYRHICSHCFSTFGKNFGHSEVDCRNK